MPSDGERYRAALHGIQSGIAMLMQREPALVEPKHLRVGIDSAHVTDAGLADLLIEKGIFTREEYVKACADAAEAERQRFEDELREKFGVQVTLR